MEIAKRVQEENPSSLGKDCVHQILIFPLMLFYVCTKRFAFVPPQMSNLGPIHSQMIYVHSIFSAVATQ